MNIYTVDWYALPCVNNQSNRACSVIYLFCFAVIETPKIFPYNAMKTDFDARSRYGSCQFEAVCHQLKRRGIRTVKSDQLRVEVVEYMERNDWSGFLLGDQKWNDYLEDMAKPETYGDNLTLQAIANVCRIQILVLSSAGISHITYLKPHNDDGSQKLKFITLGYQHKMEHYVSVWIEGCDQMTIDQLVQDQRAVVAMIQKDNMPANCSNLHIKYDFYINEKIEKK